jgi:hypothetical protein|tara:strand:- start:619 stop:720 length:102 start_codon:yes stop_codon:yes gene_type:complete
MNINVDINKTPFNDGVTLELLGIYNKKEHEYAL